MCDLLWSGFHYARQTWQGLKFVNTSDIPARHLRSAEASRDIFNENYRKVYASCVLGNFRSLVAKSLISETKEDFTTHLRYFPSKRHTFCCNPYEYKHLEIHLMQFIPGGGGGGHSHQLPYGGVPLYRVDFERPVSLK